MFISPTVRIWLRPLPVLLTCLGLLSCAAPPEKPAPGAWSGRPFGSPPAPNPALKKAMISRATREWEYFGRQTVV